MMKVMDLGSSLPGLIHGAILTILVLALVGCQHTSATKRELRPDGWRVLERIGDTRQALEASFEAIPIWPGETITDNRQVTTGRGAGLILARGGIQLTVGENTSLRLPVDVAASGLVLDKGWIRLRLATAANGMARVKTAEFDINGTRTTLALHAGEQGTELLVETGSATLATIDGRHHATLAAGAAARIDQAWGSDLWIRPAKGLNFAKVTPLAAEIQPRTDDHDAPTLKKPEAETAGLGPYPQDPGSAKISVTTKTVAIREASRLKEINAGLPTVSSPIEAADLPPSLSNTTLKLTPQPATLQSLLPKSPLPHSAVLQKPMIEPAISKDSDEIPESSNDMWPVDPPLWQADTSDPIQTNFNRLTEGLVDGL